MNRQNFLDSFGHIADAPGGIDMLRRLILDLAVRGRLTSPVDTDEPATLLLEAIGAQRKRCLNAGEISRARDNIALSGVEGFYPLPTGWVWARFGDASINLDSKRVPLSASERSERRGTHDYYGASGVIDSIDDYLFDRPLLLVGEDGANLLRRSTPVAFIARGQYWVNNHAHVLDSVDVSCLAYLAIFINAIDLTPYVTGTAQPKLNQSNLNRIPVAVPPLEEQKRIVDRVDELTRLCDELEAQQTARAGARSTLTVATLHRMSEADSADDLRDGVAAFADNIGLYLAPGEGDLAVLKRVRHTILDLAVQGRLTHRDPSDEPAAELLKRIVAERERMVTAKEIRRSRAAHEFQGAGPAGAIPLGWTWTPLGALGAWGAGATPSRSNSQYYGGSIAWLKSGELNDGYVASSEETITELAFRETSVKLRRVGDVLIAMYGATIGRTAILEIESTTNQAVCGCTPFDGVYNRYLHLQLQSLRKNFVGQGAGGAQPNISKEKIEAQLVLLPPTKEQRRIVKCVDELMDLCDELKQRFLFAQALRRDLADSVVAHAVANGEDRLAVGA